MGGPEGDAMTRASWTVTTRLPLGKTEKKVFSGEAEARKYVQLQRERLPLAKVRLSTRSGKP